MCVVLVGCVTTPDISKLSPDERLRSNQILVYESISLPPESYVILDTVDGISGRRSIYSNKVVTKEEAIHYMKIKAAMLGADAIINVVCKQSDGVDWANNMWDSIVCVGEAVKIVRPELLPAPQSEAPSLSGITFGTGWTAFPGVIVTNNHVIQGKSQITLLGSEAKRTSATVAARDIVNDLAILLPEDKTILKKALPLSEQVSRPGARVFTIGYPHPTIMGGTAKVTDGVISALSGIQDDPRVYQITVPLQSGNSGGPILNASGEVIGVATSKLNAAYVFQWTGDLPENVNYAIKTQYLEPLLQIPEVVNVSLEVFIPKDAALEDIVQEVQDSVVLVIAQ